MRRDLVLEVLGAAGEELFEDVAYTPLGGVTVTIERAIFGIEEAAVEVETFGSAVRVGTHLTRVLKSTFPNLRKGDRFNDGLALYEVLDSRPPQDGDGRLEIEISLKKV